MREFETGATRNDDGSKPDYDGFFSPAVMRRFGEYMHEHRRQANGTVRASDNWQKGIPVDAYMKSLWRHFMDVWSIHRGLTVLSPEDGHEVALIEALMAVLFNTQGMAHELLQAQERGQAEEPDRVVLARERVLTRMVNRQMYETYGETVDCPDIEGRDL